MRQKKNEKKESHYMSKANQRSQEVTCQEQTIRRHHNYYSSSENNLKFERNQKKSEERPKNDVKICRVFKGYSTQLEKPYFRLCGPPNPGDIRPLSMLEKSYSYCLDKWKIEKKSYSYIQEQLRSIRQDLTVQRIRNAFTIEVYETHARLALQHNDLDQFNQCQAQLSDLYRLFEVSKLTNYIEFRCYLIIYLSLMNMPYELIKLLKDLSDSEHRSDAIKEALYFHRALAENNYHRVLLIFKTSKTYLVSNLINLFLKRLRLGYLYLICKSHYTVTLYHLTKELCFSTSLECQTFLMHHKVQWLIDDKNNGVIVDCRKSLLSLQL